MTEPTVCAVVVTYDRPDTLEECLACIDEQSRRPDTILIVDNGSPAPCQLAERTASPPIILLELEENTGPAGGFATGIREALELGSTHLWLMDDDVRPQPSCLELLLEWSKCHGAELVFPEVRDRSGTTTNFPGWSAVLLATSAVRRAGLPRAELFWWIEDTEYLQWRLPRVYGVPTGRCSAALAIHGPGQRPLHKPAWKYYYEVRNTAYYRLWVQEGAVARRSSRLLIVVLQSLYRSVIRERSSRTFWLVILGLWHGIRKRLGKSVMPGLDSSSSPPSETEMS